MIPSYNKIITLGSMYTENALIGEIIIQEKVDGSQFRWCIDENGELIIGSKSCIISHPDENKMFKEGVEYLLSIANKIKQYPKNTYFFGEYLKKPRHNVLKYDKIPKNHIVLFDVIINQNYASREQLIQISKNLEIDLIPELYKGILTIEKIKDFFTIQSYLGGEIIEGIVIKNYTQLYNLGGKIYPLFTKYVRDAFKERHDVEWKSHSPKTTIQDYINGFKCEARWIKSILHLKEQNKLENSSKDIGFLIKAIQEDIKEEETENIKNYLYKQFISEIIRKSVQGFPEWYKKYLLKNLNQNKE